ncbi:uncharacterized protein METZ01_LOCUS85463 [marine metagenome]|uniref:Uncharacterized protein n=1 Tax=marine metagenome TaxID=408172 RepID=A0A381UWU0_9ZZZZ
MDVSRRLTHLSMLKEILLKPKVYIYYQALLMIRFTLGSRA